MNRPSAEIMKIMNSMIKPYGVPYYTEKESAFVFEEIDDADKTEAASAISDVNGYIDHYVLKYGDVILDDDQKNYLINHFWDNYRTHFGREYDRIICTNSFRRLQYKTQVMVNSASDEQRTRLLHSLEVQRIAKKIALGIGANAELAENIAIAHDIGHAPFGHSGEEAISEFLAPKDKEGKPLTSDAYFLHAMQSTKVLDYIATHPILQAKGINGLGLSDYVLEGVLKHDSDVFAEKITSNDVKTQYDAQRLCGIVGVDENYINNEIRKQLKDINGAVFPQVLIGSVKSQIVAWADKIAYLGHDWEEFLDTKLLEKLMSRLNDMVGEMHVIGEAENTSKTKDSEKDHIVKICEYLKEIEAFYNPSVDQKSGDHWNSVRSILLNIITEITAIDSTKKFVYFTQKEYLALKDYFAMVLSWAKLLDEVPKRKALKYDPIYVFYLYLSNIRTTIITKKVTDKLIKGSQSILTRLRNFECNGKDRKEYLIYCNKHWAKIYNEIQNDSSESDQVPQNPKQKKKMLKDSVRTCYLVQFGVETGNTAIYKPRKIKKDTHGYYNFDDTYCCLLNIIGGIISQYIGSTRVNFMAQQAKKIVTGLMEYYIAHPEMLPYSQRKRFKKDPQVYMDEYKYFVADYVAGMTDRMAKKKYDEIMSSDTKWSNEYSSGLN